MMESNRSWITNFQTGGDFHGKDSATQRQWKKSRENGNG